MTTTQTTARDAAAGALETLRERLGADAPERAELLSANAYRIAEAWERRWWARCQSTGAFNTGGWFNAAGPSRTSPPGAKAMTNPNFAWNVQNLLMEIQRGDAHYGSSWPRYRDRAWQRVADAANAAIRLLEQWDEVPQAEPVTVVLSCRHLKSLPALPSLPDVATCYQCDPTMERAITGLSGEDGDQA